MGQQVGLGSFADAPTYMGVHNSQATINRMELLDKNPPIYFRKNLESMIGITKIHKVKIMFSTWAHSPYFGDYASNAAYQQGFKENNQIVKMVAREHKIPVFDFAEAMPKEKSYWADGRHVNEMGALVKAELFAKFIDEYGLIEISSKEEMVRRMGK